MLHGAKKIDGRYDVLRSIGRGMSGEVFLVTDQDGSKALKLLSELQLNVSRTDALANFKKEFSILKELNHPNIAHILDFGYEEELRKYFFTSEFINGADFHVACTGKTHDEIEELAIQVLRALNYLHARKIHHFDIKPQNVLVSANDSGLALAKIIDFGLADFTSPLKKVGSPGYMAPEMILGNKPDNRADLYSMGVMFYKAFTGTNPFTGKTLKETLSLQLDLKPKPASSLNPSLPKYWDHILARLLEKDPDRRYTEASHVIRDVNFLTQKSYEIETLDTRLSYLPERGKLIARGEAWRMFQKVFDETFSETARVEPKLVILEGEKGTGKTRLLAEIRHAAQLKKVPVRVYDATLVIGNLPERSVLSIDDGETTSEQISDILRELGGKKTLVIWTCESAPTHWQNATVIPLKNYSRQELGEYLSSVTGFSHMPDWLIQEIDQRTQGNPLFVAEFVKSLIERDVLLDASGRWQATLLEDVRIDFDGITIPLNLEECLKTRLTQITPLEKKLLDALAVHEAPLSATELREIMDSSPEASLVKLAASDFIEPTTERGYFFKNILMANVIRKTLSIPESLRLHRRLATLFADDPKQRHLHLRHRCHDRDPEKSHAAFRELGALHLKKTEYAKAATAYENLIERMETSGSSAELGDYLNLGKALTLMRNLDRATNHYENLLNKRKSQSSADELLEILKELTDLAFKHSDLGAVDAHLAHAERHCQTAKTLIGASSNVLFWNVIFQNFEAHLMLKRGHTDEALAVFKTTHEIWKLNLSDTDKVRVINNRLVEIYHLKRDYAAAINYCLEKMSLLENLGEKYPLALNCYSLAMTYYLKAVNEKCANSEELYDLSIENFQRSERIARAIGNAPLMLRAFNGIGNVRMTMNDKDSALEFYRRALAVARQSGETEMAGFAAYNIATIHKDAKTDHEAYSHFIYAANTLESLVLRGPYAEFILFMTQLNLAEIDLRLGDKKSARHAIERADALFETSTMAKSYESLRSLVKAKLSYHEGNIEDGDAWIKKAQSQCHTPEQQLIIDKYLEAEGE